MNQKHKNGLEHDSSKEPGAYCAHIFKITSNKLKLMFMVQSEENLNDPIDSLKEYGFAKGLLHKLATDSDSGIIGDDRDLLRRKRQFGANDKPLDPVPKLTDSIKQTIMEPLWLVMIISALISWLVNSFLGTGGFYQKTGEAISILLAAFGLIAITALADWIKDNRFVKLQSLIKEDKITVIRGKSGACQTISIWELVVGDVVLLNTGAQVPADCLVLTAADLEISPPNQGVDGNPLKKQPYGGVGYDVDSDPFLHVGSMVTRGQCKALVCCVGKESSYDEDQTQKLQINEDTPLQKKLKNLTDQFTLGALYSAILVFLVLVIRSIIQVSMMKEGEGGTGVLVGKIAGFLNIAVVLIVVSVPEGLPLTIGVSLAFSVMKMYSEKILVRKLDAPERLGGVDEICCGKTATLTKNKMRVTEFYCESKHIRNTRKDTFIQCDLSPEAMLRIKECIVYNCEAKVEMDATTYIPVGSGTEVGLLRFLQDADIPIHLQINWKLGKTKMISPHTPDRKRSATAVECPDRPGRVVIYVKGAPETTLDHCRDMLCTDPQISVDGRTAELGPNERAAIIEKIDKMAAQPLRVLGLAYWEMDTSEWEQMFDRDASRSPDRAFEEMMLSGQARLTWIGAIGLRDPLRQGVTESIRFAREKANLGVRLVSGDHIETAKAAAVQSGILLPHETAQPYAVMTGEAFRSMVGTIQRTHNPTTDEVEETIEHLDAFGEVADQLRVLARATPFDKAILVRGLKCLGKNVAVTGDGISDVEPLKISDVGLAMGSGCSAAINSADVVLTDDDFEATIQAIKWGRNIFHNVSRFLQFQVTVNISALLTVLIGGLFLGQSPFNAVQLLWINLLMDTFAAIALSTEPPVDSVTEGQPFKGNAAVLSASVWRQILGISAWNTLLMSFKFVAIIADPGYKAGADIDSPDGLVLKTGLTEVFHTFVFLQIFNYINCRKVGRQDFNVFEEFGHNFYFLGVLFGTASFQVVLGTYLHGIAGTVELVKPAEWGQCVLVGSTTLIASAVLKLLPSKLVDMIASKLPDSLVNEDRQVENKTLQAWDKINQLPVTGRRNQDDYYDAADDNSAENDQEVDNDFLKA